MTITVTTLAVLCFAVASNGQGTLRITFDGPPPQAPGTAMLVTRYDEAGLSFTPISTNDGRHAFVRRGGGTLGYPENGTAYVQAGLGTTLMFTFTNRSVFDIVSVDLAGYSTVVPEGYFRFVGYRHSGEVVTNDITINGIAFQTFALGPQFTGLDRVEIPSTPWSLDNLVLRVPEPACAALAAWGLVLLAARWRMARPKPRAPARAA